MHPLVDQLEADLGDNAKVLRVSIATATGRKLMSEMAVVSVPQFVVLDHNSTEQWRGDSVPSLQRVLSV